MDGHSHFSIKTIHNTYIDIEAIVYRNFLDAILPQRGHNEAQILMALERGIINHRKDNKQRGLRGVHEMSYLKRNTLPSLQASVLKHFHYGPQPKRSFCGGNSPMHLGKAIRLNFLKKCCHMY